MPVAGSPSQNSVAPLQLTTGRLLQVGQGSLPANAVQPSPAMQYSVSTLQVLSPHANVVAAEGHAFVCEPPESGVPLPPESGVVLPPESGDDEVPASVSPPVEPPPLLELELHA